MVQFLKFVINKLEKDPLFMNDIVWTDKSPYSRTGVVNRQNTHCGLCKIHMSYNPTRIKYDGPLMFGMASGREC